MMHMRDLRHEVNDMQPTWRCLRASFSGETFDDLAAQSQQHGKEMFGANDGAHMEAMSKMMELMKSSDMDSWIAARKAELDAL